MQLSGENIHSMARTISRTAKEPPLQNWRLTGRYTGLSSTFDCVIAA